jgi:hypothetical protein
MCQVILGGVSSLTRSNILLTYSNVFITKTNSFISIIGIITKFFIDILFIQFLLEIRLVINFIN